MGGDEPLKISSLPQRPVDFTELAQALRPLSNEKRLELLHFLTRPHYLEEIASHLGMARQAAEKHVEQLLEIGVIRKQPGQRDSGPVMEYVVVPQRLFTLSEEFAKLGVLKPLEEFDEALLRTQIGTTAPPAAAGKAGPALVVVHGLHAGTVHRLGPAAGPWTIGRDPERQIALDYDPFVSNRHAEVRRDGDAFALVDTFSTNGTFLNWARLDRGASVPLSPGDVVGVGKSLLVFRH